MITPEKFPYIKSLHVNDCYTYKDFNVELYDYKPFSHLILTGKNGSGKSTILRAINGRISKLRHDIDTDFANAYKQVKEDDGILVYSSREAQMIRIKTVNYQSKYLVEPEQPEYIWRSQSGKFIYSYLRTRRSSKVNGVETPTKEQDFIDQINDSSSVELFTDKFVQYLVNKKVNQAFDQLSQDKASIKNSEVFFTGFTEVLQRVFGDNDLELLFKRETFDFIIELSDGREITFDILPDGFSALLSVLMDLLVRVDLIRKQVNDYSYNPCGIVLIDEPETHLHLQLQEQVLPLLTSLFPNIQFIAATHSPAVIASIKNATIFDLTTKESRNSEDTVGRSYSDLMTTHFGLDNEYSSTADEIIRQVNEVLNSPDISLGDKKRTLQAIYDANSVYLAPTLKVELELLIAQNEAQQIAHQ